MAGFLYYVSCVVFVAVIWAYWRPKPPKKKAKSSTVEEESKKESKEVCELPSESVCIIEKGHDVDISTVVGDTIKEAKDGDLITQVDHTVEAQDVAVLEKKTNASIKVEEEIVEEIKDVIQESQILAEVKEEEEGEKTVDDKPTFEISTMDNIGDGPGTKEDTSLDSGVDEGLSPDIADSKSMESIEPIKEKQEDAIGAIMDSKNELPAKVNDEIIVQTSIDSEACMEKVPIKHDFECTKHDPETEKDFEVTMEQSVPNEPIITADEAEYTVQVSTDEPADISNINEAIEDDILHLKDVPESSSGIETDSGTGSPDTAPVNIPEDSAVCIREENQYKSQPIESINLDTNDEIIEKEEIESVKESDFKDKIDTELTDTEADQNAGTCFDKEQIDELKVSVDISIPVDETKQANLDVEEAPMVVSDRKSERLLTSVASVEVKDDIDAELQDHSDVNVEEHIPNSEQVQDECLQVGHVKTIGEIKSEQDTGKPGDESKPVSVDEKEMPIAEKNLDAGVSKLDKEIVPENISDVSIEHELVADEGDQVDEAPVIDETIRLETKKEICVATDDATLVNLEEDKIPVDEAKFVSDLKSEKHVAPVEATYEKIDSETKPVMMDEAQTIDKTDEPEAEQETSASVETRLHVDEEKVPVPIDSKSGDQLENVAHREIDDETKVFSDTKADEQVSETLVDEVLEIDEKETVGNADETKAINEEEIAEEVEGEVSDSKPEDQLEDMSPTIDEEIVAESKDATDVLVESELKSDEQVSDDQDQGDKEPVVAEKADELEAKQTTETVDETKCVEEEEPVDVEEVEEDVSNSKSEDQLEDEARITDEIVEESKDATDVLVESEIKSDDQVSDDQDQGDKEQVVVEKADELEAKQETTETVDETQSEDQLEDVACITDEIVESEIKSDDQVSDDQDQGDKEPVVVEKADELEAKQETTETVDETQSEDQLEDVACITDEIVEESKDATDVLVESEIKSDEQVSDDQDQGDKEPVVEKADELEAKQETTETVDETQSEDQLENVACITDEIVEESKDATDVLVESEIKSDEQVSDDQVQSDEEPVVVEKADELEAKQETTETVDETQSEDQLEDVACITDEIVEESKYATDVLVKSEIKSDDQVQSDEEPVVVEKADELEAKQGKSEDQLEDVACITDEIVEESNDAPDVLVESEIKSDDQISDDQDQGDEEPVVVEITDELEANQETTETVDETKCVEEEEPVDVEEVEEDVSNSKSEDQLEDEACVTDEIIEESKDASDVLVESEIKSDERVSDDKVQGDEEPEVVEKADELEAKQETTETVDETKNVEEEPVDVKEVQDQLEDVITAEVSDKEGVIETKDVKEVPVEHGNISDEAQVVDETTDELKAEQEMSAPIYEEVPVDTVVDVHDVCDSDSDQLEDVAHGEIDDETKDFSDTEADEQVSETRVDEVPMIDETADKKETVENADETKAINEEEVTEEVEGEVSDSKPEDQLEDMLPTSEHPPEFVTSVDITDQEIIKETKDPSTVSVGDSEPKSDEQVTHNKALAIDEKTDELEADQGTCTPIAEGLSIDEDEVPDVVEKVDVSDLKSEELLVDRAAVEISEEIISATQGESEQIPNEGAQMIDEKTDELKAEQGTSVPIDAKMPLNVELPVQIDSTSGDQPEDVAPSTDEDIVAEKEHTSDATVEEIPDAQDTEEIIDPVDKTLILSEEEVPVDDAKVEVDVGDAKSEDQLEDEAPVKETLIESKDGCDITDQPQKSDNIEDAITTDDRILCKSPENIDKETTAELTISEPDNTVEYIPTSTIDDVEKDTSDVLEILRVDETTPPPPSEDAFEVKPVIVAQDDREILVEAADVQKESSEELDKEWEIIESPDKHLVDGPVEVEESDVMEMPDGGSAAPLDLAVKDTNGNACDASEANGFAYSPVKDISEDSLERDYDPDSLEVKPDSTITRDIDEDSLEQIEDQPLDIQESSD
ncbi:uncharacterized protein LOC144345896 [Saccoglossus kowalevskii]